MVIQLSDIHYGDNSNQDHDLQLHKMITLEAVPQVHNAIKEHDPTSILIVLNGDYTNHRSKRPIFEQMRISIEKTLLPLETSIKEVWPHIGLDCVAVPGNHDVDRTVKSRKFENTNAVEVCAERLATFYEVIAEFNNGRSNSEIIRTPQDGPFKLPLGSLDVVVWPIDSAYRCGANSSDGGEGPGVITDVDDADNLVIPAKLDLLRVRKKAIDDCQAFLHESCGEHDNSLRIAIIHHSPVAATARREAHIFEDAGAFIEFLMENRFNVLLHGHNHETSVIPIGEVGRSQTSPEANAPHIKNQISRPFLESSVTCIGSRSLWPGAEPEKGFNIITFSQLDKSYLLHACLREVSISSHRLSSSKRRGVSNVEKLSFYIPSRPLSSLRNADSRRRSILRNVKNNYSNIHVSEYDRESDLSESALSNLQRTRDAFRRFSITHAAYAINNIRPSDWLNLGFLETITPYAEIGVLRGQKFAIERGTGETQSYLERKYGFCFPVFAYSKWLCDAVDRSCLLASRLGTSDQLDKFFEDEHGIFPDSDRPNPFSLRRDELLSVWRSQRRFIDLTGAPVKGQHSLSYWASSTAGGRVLHSAIDFDLTRLEEYELDEHHDKIRSFHEFPRLLLWRPNEFTKPSAFKVIDFHEQNGIPLFWLDPDRLISRGGDLKRSKIGASEYFGHYRKKRMVRHIGYNNADGEHPKASCFNVSNPFAVNLPARLWGFDDELMEHLGPRSFRKSSPAEEFRVLCSRPDLLLAIDAWFLTQTIGENGLRRVLDPLNNDVAAWLEYTDL